MGNRAVITTYPYDENNIGIYLHFNGDIDNVNAFLQYCKLKEYKNPVSDPRGWAYLAGVVSNFFGDGNSCAINKVSSLDTNNRDNGTYLINENWEVKKAIFSDNTDSQDLGAVDYEMMIRIDSRQPKHMQIGYDKLNTILNRESQRKNKG